jgi:small subunit ribosomal protein S9
MAKKTTTKTTSPVSKVSKYTEAVGRRKTATARVRITPSKKDHMVVNDKSVSDYFKRNVLVDIARAALAISGGKHEVSARVSGGGPEAQAEAVRHATARALVILNPEQRKDLKVRGFLKRDPRMKERKKFGLKGARRAPQWSKR